MRSLVHLSDLHFNRIEPQLLEPLRAMVIESKPDLIVVSGDLTQRARHGQFLAARKFLDSFPFRKIIVPGNHDVPLYNVFRRFANPLRNFRRWISQETEPSFFDDELAIVGVNSARSNTFKNGRINDDQLSRVVNLFALAPRNATRILVCHHPFELPPGVKRQRAIGGARQAIATLSAAHVDLVLSGHFHLSHTGQAVEEIEPAPGITRQSSKSDGSFGTADVRSQKSFPRRTFLLVHSGTATSSRTRGEANAFNVIRIARPRLTIERFWWSRDEVRFKQALAEDFVLGESGWQSIATPENSSS